MFYDLENKKPKNSGENWVAPNGVIGDVTLEKILAFGLMLLRGDIENIHIERAQMSKTVASTLILVICKK